MTDTITELSVTGHWINGAVATSTGEIINLVSPVTGEVVATVPSGSAADVDRAVRAARAAARVSVPLFTTTPD